MTGSNTVWSFTIEGQPEPPLGRVPQAGFRAVTPGYFQAMGIPLLRGRHFTDRDGEGRSPAVMINEAMARQYWPNQDVLGKRIKPGALRRRVLSSALSGTSGFRASTPMPPPRCTGRLGTVRVTA
jgi:hypothetical protein